MENEKQEKQQNYSLTVQGSSEFGKALIGKAQDIAKEKASKFVIEYVSDLMEKVETQRNVLTSLQGDLAAIEAGEFSITKAGHLVFNDPKRGAVHTLGNQVARCPRCRMDI